MPEPTIYTLHVPDGVEGTVMTAPRPLPGRLIGAIGTTAYPVYDIADNYLEPARALDAKPVLPITATEIAGAVEAWAAENGYPMAEVRDVYDNDLYRAFLDVGLGAIITISEIGVEP
jgi:hypothetical protein